MHKTNILFKFLLLLSLVPAMLPAQTIDIRLPYYAGRDYYFCLQQGARQDTLATGILNINGTVINLPEDFRGVGRLTVSEFGRLWNVVINGNENIRMSEPDIQDADPAFENSTENAFLLNAIARQSEIINNYFETASQSEHQSFVLASPEQRLQGIENEYQAFRRQISDSPLYAARMIEILNCLTGAGSSFAVSTDDILAEQRQFVARRVDFADLYTSGFWQPAFDVWIQSASVVGQGNDSLLLNDSRHMLERCADVPMRREVTQTLIRQFSKYGKDYLLAELGEEFITMPLNGQPAPEIVAAEGSFVPKSSLIIFYETGCGTCHYELEELKGKYRTLTDNNIKVISIAADVGRDVFEETAGKLPWADKICDFKHFDGDNFKNYGIVGTPTYILTDDEGVVRGRYAQLKELLK